MTDVPTSKDQSARPARSGMNALVTLVFALLTASIFISIFFPQLSPVSQNEARNWVTSFDNDKAVFIGLQVIQVIIPPISHYFTSMLGGFIYGPVEGGVLNFVGRVVGQMLAFALAYKGAHWISRYRPRILERFQRLVSGDGSNLPLRALIIFSMIALPFFPDDELSYAMGFARFPVRYFVVITVLGHGLGSFALAFLGSGEEFRGPLFISLVAITLACFVALIWAAIRFRSAS